MALPDHWVMTVHKASEPDRNEVVRAIKLLVDPAHCVQIQALPSGRYVHIPGREVERIADAVVEYGDEKGVYLNLNPFAGPPKGAVCNKDVIARRWFLVDPDATKPEGLGKDASTSDREKGLALEVAEAIREFLNGHGWPDPIFVDSGNNWQLLYRVDLPNDKLAQQLLQKCLKRLAARFDSDAVKVDLGVHDARRICKVPGTWVRKGENSPERPHRISRLVAVPDPVAVVPVETIKALADLPEEGDEGYKVLPPKAIADPWRMEVGGDDRKAYARSAMEREVGIVAMSVAPGRNARLYEAAMKLGSLVAADLLDEGEVLSQLRRAAGLCGLGGDGDPKEVDRAIANGIKVGRETPREVPDRNGKAHAKGKGNGKPVVPPMAPDDPMVIQASSVTPKVVDWLWRNRIPRGFITIFAGRTGLGKSFVTCDITATVTTGGSFTDANGECVDPGNVLLISEDPFEYVLTPRLIEAGAELKRVFYMSWEAMAHYQLDDTDMLGRAAALAGEPTLVVIDPPTNFLGNRDEHKNAEVRSVLMRLVTWLKSRERPVACILITHVNKGGGKGVEALNRVIGSVAWTTTARIAHTFSTDPEDPARCLFVPMKNNLGPLAKGLSYRIATTESFAKVEWLGEVETTADQAMDQEGGAPKQKRAETATAWLLTKFGERDEWPSEELFRLAEEAGISRSAIFEAKKSLDLPKARPVMQPDGSKAWVWKGPLCVPIVADETSF